MAQKKILSDSQIKTIYKKIAEAFAEQLDEKILINFSSLKKQINQILTAMQLEETFHQDGQHKGWKLRNATPYRQAMAARGYLIIMKFREYLTNEKIDYRYYYEDRLGTSKATTFSENNILKYIKFGSDAIQIDPTTAKTANPAGEYNSFIQEYFSRFTGPEYMQPASGANGFLVHSTIMKQYSGSNPGLHRKDNPNQYQFFNKGHIYEGIDTALSAALIDDNENLDLMVQNYLFGKYLALDNVKASQGPDNTITSTSIKSGSADLYDYNTIKKQLEILQNVLFSGTIGREEMSNKIQELFLHKSHFNTAEEMEQTAQTYIDKIIKDLKNSIQSN